MVKITTFMALRLFSISSSLASLKVSFSKSSRTKDLTTRTLVIFSWILEFSLSILVCIMSNLGNAIRITMTSATRSSGITTPRMIASLAFISTAMIRPPISMPGARSIIRSAIMITFCIFVMSLVSLVTREPVENFSILAKENFCTFVNTSFLRLAAKLTAALTAK